MESVIIAISIIYTLIIAGLTITFWVIWFRNRRELAGYKKYGFTMGSILIGYEILSLLVLAIGGNNPPLLMVIFTDIVAFFRISAFVIVGIYYCNLLGIASFPFLMGRYGQDQVKEPETEKTFQEEILEETSQITTEQPVKDIKGMFVGTSIVTLGGVFYSLLLFWITKPQISQLMMERFGLETKMSGTGIPLTILIALEFAFAEEIVFRLGIQNFMAKKFGWQGERYWLAIIFTAIVWTIGHFGVMDPNWVKLVQVFPVGLALGWLFRKYGVESSIIAHSLFNVILLFPSEYLLS